MRLRIKQPEEGREKILFLFPFFLSFQFFHLFFAFFISFSFFYLLTSL